MYELWTNGRFVAIRPELVSGTQTIFNGTAYNYLGQSNRLLGRISTIMADTVRPPETLVAAQNAPLADGALQQNFYVHSGELESADVDLDAGGRDGFDVALQPYVPLPHHRRHCVGQAWDSPMFDASRAAERRHRIPRRSRRSGASA